MVMAAVASPAHSRLSSSAFLFSFSRLLIFVSRRPNATRSVLLFFFRFQLGQTREAPILDVALLLDCSSPKTETNLTASRTSPTTMQRKRPPKKRNPARSAAHVKHVGRRPNHGGPDIIFPRVGPFFLSSFFGLFYFVDISRSASEIDTSFNTLREPKLRGRSTSSGARGTLPAVDPSIKVSLPVSESETPSIVSPSETE